jgi:hypothetical protein
VLRHPAFNEMTAMKFSDEQLRAYIAALAEAFNFSVTVSLKPVVQHDRFITFSGLQPRRRIEQDFVVPFLSPKPGVITAQSVLVGTLGLQAMTWLLNGQANRHSREVVFIGGSSDHAVSLHASKDMVRKWLFQNFPNLPEDRQADAKAYLEKTYLQMTDRGLYADEVSIGTYVDAPNSSMLVLRLNPIASDAAEPKMEAAENTGPKI